MPGASVTLPITVKLEQQLEWIFPGRLVGGLVNVSHLLKYHGPRAHLLSTRREKCIFHKNGAIFTLIHWLGPQLFHCGDRARDIPVYIKVITRHL